MVDPASTGAKRLVAAVRYRLRFLWDTFRQFLHHDGIDKSTILAYYSIFSSFFLLIFFAFLMSRIFSQPDAALKSMYPFSAEFWSQIAPDFGERAAELAANMRQLGLIGAGFFLFLGILVFKKMILFINDMFYISLKKGFFLKRLKEFTLLAGVGILAIASFIATGIISAVGAVIQKGRLFRGRLDPRFVDTVDHFLIKYLVPLAITLTLFFVLYKWIPEKSIHTRSALTAAIVAALLWETTKWIYTYYLVHISLIGKIKGPIIAIILFGFWMEISMGIMLYGAKLTYTLDKERHVPA